MIYFILEREKIEGEIILKFSERKFDLKLDSFIFTDSEEVFKDTFGNTNKKYDEPITLNKEMKRRKTKEIDYDKIPKWPRWCSGNTRACGALVSGSNPGRGPLKINQFEEGV